MKTKKLLFWVVFFSISMGFLEAAVVIYLRQLLYPGPEGFTFPLRPMHHNLALVELSREAATIIMLLAVGHMAGKNKPERLAWFLFSFAVWDIFYYVFLYAFLAWPQSLLTWDILFLIPVPWSGPVLSPVIIDFEMILFAMLLIHYSGKKGEASLRWPERLLLAVGGLIVVAAFMQDYISQNLAVLGHDITNATSLLSEMYHYAPACFNWYLFSFGAAVILLSCGMYVRRLRGESTAV